LIDEQQAILLLQMQSWGYFL